jgi:hypothetical protein
MSLITSAVIAAALLAAGAVSAIDIASRNASGIEAARTYGWSAQASFSGEARRARAQAVTPARQATPFTRISLESLT